MTGTSKAAIESSRDYSRHLNPEQYAAVMHGEGPALVLAGAGTGKTRVVTYRVARLIDEGVCPENLLLLTFTNKAAREMMTRAEGLVGREISGLWGGTFHHVANLVLRRHCSLLGYRPGFSIMDRDDSRGLLAECVTEVCGKDAGLPKPAVLGEICSLHRNTGAAIADLVFRRLLHTADAAEAIERVALRYEEKKRSLNVMDFDDLLVNWRELLEQHESVRRRYAEKFRYVLVDEYQDTNSLQSRIIELIAGTGNLMAVGDDAQSVYSFRGADFENILRFSERYGDTAVYALTMNYRSTPEILVLANRVISFNRRQFRKELRPAGQSGQPPFVVAARDIYQEARFVASVIRDTIAGGTPPQEIAVLYRSHYQSMQVQMELQKRGMPFEVRSGLRFFEQAHVKDVLAYLRIVLNPLDEMSWKRVMKLVPGIGNATASKIWKNIMTSPDPVSQVLQAERLVPRKSAAAFVRFRLLIEGLVDGGFAALSGGASAAMHYVMDHGYEDYLYDNFPDAESRKEDIAQVAGFAAGYDSLDTFLSDMALLSTDAEDRGGGPGGSVVLSTVHQAKGLEWRVVLIIGVNDGRFPSQKSLRDGDEEEERRLLYVAATRAKEALYVCYSVMAEEWNTAGFLRPSRFIKELPSSCFEEITAPDV